VTVGFGFDGDPTGGVGKSYVNFIGLNPSTADETTNDATIRKCRGFASRWGYREMYVTNLFAVRATFPSDMMAHSFPEGDDNARWIQRIASGAGLVVACWGNHGSFNGRSREALARLNGDGIKVWHLGLNKSGEPKHPLYVRYSTLPQMLATE